MNHMAFWVGVEGNPYDLGGGLLSREQELPEF